MIINPSFEVDTYGWAGLNTGAIYAVPPPSMAVGMIYGGQIGSVELNAASGDGAYYPITLAQTTAYYFRMQVAAFAGYTITAEVTRVDTGAVVGTGSIALTPLGMAGYRFSELALTFTTPATTAFSLRIKHTAGVLSPIFPYFMIDGVQIATTEIEYVDGDQPECQWEGQPHRSISRTRFNGATNRAVGMPVDFQDDYGFYVSGDGVGMAAPTYGSAERAAPLPGAVVRAVRTPSREIALSGVLVGTTYADLRRRRNRLIADVAPDTTPLVNGVPQPVHLRYVGVYKTLELLVDYIEGLQQPLAGVQAYTERLAVRFMAHDDPYWRETANTAVAIDGETLLDVYGVSARLAGAWSALGVTSLGGNGIVYAVAWGQDGKLYFAGDFTSVNADADMAYLARYDPVTAAPEALNATPLGGIVRALFFAPDNTLYIGGDFTNAGGDANADYVCSFLDTVWGGAGGYAPLTAANPLDGAVRAFAFNPTTGAVYLGGSFTASGATTLNRVTSYDGSTFAAIGTGLDGAVYALAYLNDGAGTLLVGGAFSTAGGNAAPYLAAYAGGAWFAVGSSGPNAAVHALAAWNEGAAVGGAFTTMDGESAAYVFQLTALSATYTGWRGLGEGGGAAVGGLQVAGGYLYATLNSANRKIGMWNGAVWLAVNTAVAGAAVVYAVAVNHYGEVAYGSNAAGTTYVAATNSLTLGEGAAETYPVLTIQRVGGTFVQFRSITNEARGQAIYLNALLLLDGETVTLDCQTLALKSSFGRTLAVLPGSTPVMLSAGENQLAIFAPQDGSTGRRVLTYLPRYWSYDAAEVSD